MITREDCLKLVAESYTKGARDALESLSEACLTKNQIMIPVSLLNQYASTFTEEKAQSFVKLLMENKS
jgi:predicted nucleotidyltransferase